MRQLLDTRRAQKRRESQISPLLPHQVQTLTEPIPPEVAKPSAESGVAVIGTASA
jgi:hypothetical protein